MPEALSWMVFCEDVNARRIEPYNIFRHTGFKKECVKAAQTFDKDKDGFSKEIMRWLKYYFWSKCEWEIVLSSWPVDDRTPKEKIDVCDQVLLNFDAFVDYIWERKGLLVKEASEL